MNKAPAIDLVKRAWKKITGKAGKEAAEEAAARLAALVPDAVLLGRLRKLCPDAELLERLLLKVERPETLEKYLGRMGPRELEKAIEATAARGVPQGLTEQQFAQMSVRIRAAAGRYGDDIRVQGSRAAGAASKDTKDIDVAIRVSPERFDEIIKERFKVPNPGGSKEKTMLHAIETGKIQRGELGLSGVGREVEKGLSMEVDISVIRIGGATDKGPVDDAEVNSSLVDLDDLSARLFVDGLGRDDLVSMLSPLVAGSVDGRWIDGDGVTLVVENNDDADPVRRSDRDGGFRFFALLVEVYFADSRTEQQRAKVVGQLLEHLWSRGLAAVAAADYEESLPHGGGVGELSLPWPTKPS